MQRYEKKSIYASFGEGKRVGYAFYMQLYEHRIVPLHALRVGEKNRGVMNFING